MKIQTQQRVISSDKPRVSIDPNPRREREMLDKDGNVIDFRTKQIIRRKGEQE